MIIPIKKFKKGAFIYLSGNQPLKEFYIIKSGSVRIFKTNEMLGIKEEIKRDGSIIGIIQCITGIAAEENVVALSDCEIFIIAKDKLADLFAYHKKIILKIISEYSEILRKLDSDLINFNFFSENSDREAKTIEIAKKFVALNQREKASHLLLSVIQECKENKEFTKEAVKLMTLLPKVDLIQTKKIIEEIKIEKEKVIFTEFEKGDSFFIIKSGRVKITKLKNNKELLLAILGESDIFGEMAILNDKPRNATAIAEDDCELMVVKKSGIEQLPTPIFLKVLDFLTKRIWLVQRQIVCYKITIPVAKIYYFLASKMILELKTPEKEKDKPYTFRFSVNELYEMIDYEYDKTRSNEELYDFLADKNIELYHDRIRIKNIGIFMDKSSYLLSRALNLYSTRA